MIRTTWPIRWLLMAAILACSIGCDQATKRVARAQLKGAAPRSYCGDVLRLEYAENPGAFLGLGGEMPAAARWAVLIVFNSLVAGAIAVILLLDRPMRGERWLACTLLLGGTVGNLIDRVRFDGLVIDFLNLGVGPLRSGIFNVADMAITAGALLLLVPLARAGEASSSRV